MAGERWWSKSRGLPPEAHAAWSASLAHRPGRQARILAWATTPAGFAIGSPAVLSYPNSAAEDGWQHLGWHEIERGGWDSGSSRLGWVLYSGERGTVELLEVGRLPEVFRERIAASIVLEEYVPVLQHHQVLVSGRRDLAEAGGPISWHATLGRGLSRQRPGVSEAVADAIGRVRREYDLI